jgi:hypothetical protein
MAAQTGPHHISAGANFLHQAVMLAAPPHVIGPVTRTQQHSQRTDAATPLAMLSYTCPLTW